MILNIGFQLNLIQHLIDKTAAIAQLVEQLICNQQVPSSTLGGGTNLNYSLLAQLVEQVTVNHWVRGSSPRQGAIYKEIIHDTVKSSVKI